MSEWIPFTGFLTNTFMDIPYWGLILGAFVIYVLYQRYWKTTGFDHSEEESKEVSWRDLERKDDVFDLYAVPSEAKETWRDLTGRNLEEPGDPIPLFFYLVLAHIHRKASEARSWCNNWEDRVEKFETRIQQRFNDAVEDIQEFKDIADNALEKAELAENLVKENNAKIEEKRKELDEREEEFEERLEGELEAFKSEVEDDLEKQKQELEDHKEGLEKEIQEEMKGFENRLEDWKQDKDRVVEERIENIADKAHEEVKKDVQETASETALSEIKEFTTELETTSSSLMSLEKRFEELENCVEEADQSESVERHEDRLDSIVDWVDSIQQDVNSVEEEVQEYRQAVIYLIRHAERVVELQNQDVPPDSIREIIFQEMFTDEGEPLDVEPEPPQEDDDVEEEKNEDGEPGESEEDKTAKELLIELKEEEPEFIQEASQREIADRIDRSLSKVNEKLKELDLT